MAQPSVQPGDVLARKYRVERVLGQGNMGVVVAASHVDLGQRVALKFMLAGAAAQKEHRERFLREARAAVRLKSQHVTRVLDVGTLDDESPYIVMELLEGADLAAVLATRGPLSFSYAVELVLQACEAVAEAHAAGIVHRDLKPANLFLTEDVGGAPCIKVLDFGISKLAGGDLTLTQDTQALGSPLYMSPEQMNSSKDVDARSDLWALGIILYQLVAGITPFHADSIQQLCARVLMGGPTPLAELRSDAPPGFEAVVHRCLERDRERRFRNVAELAVALAPFAPASAAAYVNRVARATGAAAPVPAVSAAHAGAVSGGWSGTGSGGVAPPVGSTVVMPSPADLAGSPRASAPVLAGSSPGAQALAPAHMQPQVMAPAQAPVPGAGTFNAVAASTAASLDRSQPGLASSQNPAISALPAPAPRRAPLVLAGAAGALVVASVVVLAVLRPWAAPSVASSGIAAAPGISALPASASASAPEVLPASATAPMTASAAPSVTASAAPSSTASTAALAPTVPAKPVASNKPVVKPKGKPGVSYDDRN